VTVPLCVIFYIHAGSEQGIAQVLTLAATRAQQALTRVRRNPLARTHRLRMAMATERLGQRVEALGDMLSVVRALLGRCSPAFF
jgi:hypothetical protein